jgi:glycosyltransferase involved in cell wall biosynthesis
LKLLFLQEQPCIRALKYARGLRSFRSDIMLYFGYCGKTLDQFYGEGNDLFDGWYKIENKTDHELKKIVEQVNPELIHCHNAPDSLTVQCIRLFRGTIPVVHDVHDLLSIRHTKYDDGIKRETQTDVQVKVEERTAVEKSDGLITVSHAILEIALKKYHLDSREALVFPNFVAAGMIPKYSRNKLSSADGMVHIVYEGHLDGTRSGGHYDLYDIFKGISRHDMHLHIYPSRENALYRDFAGREPSIHYHGCVPVDVLMQELTQYDFGWSGFNTDKNRIHADTVLANKLFDYIAAGLPVISFPHKSQREFLESNGLGIVIRQIGELDEKLRSSSLTSIRKNVLEKRTTFTMEEQIGSVYRLYEVLRDRVPIKAKEEE